MTGLYVVEPGVLLGCLWALSSWQGKARQPGGELLRCLAVYGHSSPLTDNVALRTTAPSPASKGEALMAAKTYRRLLSAFCGALILFATGACGDGSSPGRQVKIDQPPRGAQPPSPPASGAVPALAQTGAAPQVGAASSSGDVSGGGPTDPAAARALAAQLPMPDPTSYDTSDGIPGYELMKQIVGYTPAGPIFNRVDTVAQCAMKAGVFDLRDLGLKAPPPPPAYRYQAFSGVLVISLSHLRSPEFLLRCVPKVVGGGPGAVDPCFTVLRYTSSAYGVTDRYIALVFGTQQRVCNDVYSSYAMFTPEVLA